nr:hypothetical transcript [Hymenolepis microstoma]
MILDNHRDNEIILMDQRSQNTVKTILHELKNCNLDYKAVVRSEISQAPTIELPPEGNPVSSKPEFAEDLNGGDNAHQTQGSYAKCPLNEEELLVDGDQHIPAEHPEVVELPLVTPGEYINPLEDWGQPQAMPAPIGWFIICFQIGSSH